MTKAAKQETEIQESKGTAVVLAPKFEQPDQEILNTDVIIPRLLLMQGLSEFVTERKANLGELVRSTTLEKVGVVGGPALNIIPLRVTAEWAEQERQGDKFKFRRAFPRTPGNEHFPWSFWRDMQGNEYDKPGALGATEWKRVKALNVFALMPGDIDAYDIEMEKVASEGRLPDLSKIVIPVMLSFRSTSYKAGQGVATFFKQLAEVAQRVPTVRSYHYQLPLTVKVDKNDKGTFYVFQVGQATALNPKYHAVAERWTATLNALKDIQVDNTGDAEAVSEGV